MVEADPVVSLQKVNWRLGPLDDVQNIICNKVKRLLGLNPVSSELRVRKKSVA